MAESVVVDSGASGWFQGKLKDPVQWWLGADGSKEDKAVRKLFMSRDRFKRKVKKKRFQ